MPKSSTTPSGTPRGDSRCGNSSRGGSSRRGTPTKVSKPFPWGTVAGSLTLAVLLIGVIAYAALNQGSGISSVLTDPDHNIKGVTITETAALTRNHVAGAVDYPGYPQSPPTGGNHVASPQQCGVYAAPIAPEHAVHSMEHGAVWITYNPDTAANQVEPLASRANGDPYLLLSPLPGQDSPIVLSAWGRQLKVETAGDKRVDEFIKGYSRTGPQTPERGASCVGNTTTGPLQAAAPNGTILPSGAATAPAAPSPATPAPPVVPSAVPTS